MMENLKNINIKIDSTGALNLYQYLIETHKNYPLDSEKSYVCDVRKLITTLENIFENYNIDYKFIKNK